MYLTTKHGVLIFETTTTAKDYANFFYLLRLP